jgi:hypothetical protein
MVWSGFLCKQLKRSTRARRFKALVRKRLTWAINNMRKNLAIIMVQQTA